MFLVATDSRIKYYLAYKKSNFVLSNLQYCLHERNYMYIEMVNFFLSVAASLNYVENVGKINLHKLPISQYMCTIFTHFVISESNNWQTCLEDILAS